MTLTLDLLTTPEDLDACVALQVALSGDRSPMILRRPILANLLCFGGLLLGAWEITTDGTRHLRGALIDMVARLHDFPARVTLFLGVDPEERGRGIGKALRIQERQILRELDVALVTWWVDPLRSIASHEAVHRLGAIAVAYDRHVYGNLHDRENAGLASDRVSIEWWLESPRVIDRLERGAAPAYERVGLHRMVVATTSRTVASGARRLLSVQPPTDDRFVLVEVPEDLDRLRELDPAAAREWRIGTRQAFEDRLSNGYVGSGFLHEAGRSFYLLERASRGDILGRTTTTSMNGRGV